MIHITHLIHMNSQPQPHISLPPLHSCTFPIPLRHRQCSCATRVPVLLVSALCSSDVFYRSPIDPPRSHVITTVMNVMM